MTGRKRKLDTPEEIDSVCFLYYRTSCTVARIARNKNVSVGVIERVLRESGVAYQKKEGLGKWH